MNLEICVEGESWNRLDTKSLVEECVNAVFYELKLNHYNVEICFLFTNNEEVKILNKTYRGIDKPTNVLSFPADSMEDACCGICDEQQTQNNEPCCNLCILGSIAFAYEIAEDEAMNQNKQFENHIRHLIVHSILHLLGYDHHNKSKADDMESLEIKILSQIGVSNPYE
jgi:probable rRNA maturation factor